MVSGNATNLTLDENSESPIRTEFPYYDVTLTVCYLVGVLQVGYYVFYMLFMGTDSPFKASRAFDYEDFVCQRKLAAPGSEEFENNANVGGAACRDATIDEDSSAMVESDTGSCSSADGGNHTGGDGGDAGDGLGCWQPRQQTQQRRRQRQEVTQRQKQQRRLHSLRAISATVPASRPGRSGGGFRGPLHRLMQSCSCMLVYSSDDDEDDDDDGDEEEDDDDKDDEEEADDDDEWNEEVQSGDKDLAGPSGSRPEKNPSSASAETQAPEVALPAGGAHREESRRRPGRPARPCASRRQQQHRRRPVAGADPAV